ERQHIVIVINLSQLYFFFSSRRRHTRLQGDWSSDVCSSDLTWNRCSRTFNEVAEKLEFTTCQIDGLSSSRNFGSLDVHNDRAKFVDGLPRFYGYAAQQSFDPGDEFSGLKRLGHIIVCAKL